MKTYNNKQKENIFQSICQNVVKLLKDKKYKLDEPLAFEKTINLVPINEISKGILKQEKDVLIKIFPFDKIIYTDKQIIVFFSKIAIDYIKNITILEEK